MGLLEFSRLDCLDLTGAVARAPLRAPLFECFARLTCSVVSVAMIGRLRI